MLLCLILCAIICFYCLVVLNYRRGAYYRLTRQPYLKVRFNIGLNGEYLTYKKLEKYEHKGAKFLFNCYLPKEDGDTTEIDLLLISESGIYVFESKNYSGWIFGNEKNKTWTQTLLQGKGKKAHRENFLNPILQNKLHIKCLLDILKREIPVHSVIVFSERCTLKKVEIHSSDVFVIKRSDVKRVVDKINNSYPNRLSPQEIEEMYQLLYPYTQVSNEVKEEHVAAIRKNHSDKIEIKDKLADKKEESVVSENPALLICPKCGGNLILRIAGKGKNEGKPFYGCSNYPKCRYIQNLDK